MYRDKEVCRAVYAGVPKGVRVFGLGGTLHEEVAAELGLPFTCEIYGDVKYNSDKTLVIDRKKKQVYLSSDADSRLTKSQTLEA